MAYITGMRSLILAMVMLMTTLATPAHATTGKTETAIFWQNIDPTDAGGQFFDRGQSYQTVIFYTNEAQKAAAEASREAVGKQLGKPIATQLLPVAAFYEAEDYHQRYYEKNSRHYNAYKQGSRREETLRKVWSRP